VQDCRIRRVWHGGCNSPGKGASLDLNICILTSPVEFFGNCWEVRHFAGSVVMFLSLPFPVSLSARTETTTRPSSRVLEIDRAALSHALTMAGCKRSLLSILIRHTLTSARLALAGVRYMQLGTTATSESYSRMTMDEFASINGRQAWANWRTIPSSLSGRLPADRPLRVIDLCCGTGESTSALAWWLPAGSTILAYEQDARFASFAQSRPYQNRRGDVIEVTVRRSSVLEKFCDGTGCPCANGSVDVVHSIGSLGCHFSADESRFIVRECKRVLVSGGFAFLDAGKAGTSAGQLTAMALNAGLIPDGRARSWWFDRYVQLSLRKPDL
jgi:SAM-dependent methyltransferase